MRRNLKNSRPRSRLRPTLPLARLYALMALFVLCIPHWAFAQQFTFRQYGQRDGLTNLSVTSLLQDREGYIWVGTENGLFRRDGTSFERFDDTDVLKDTTIDSIAEDSSGRIWIGTAQGLYLRAGRRLLPVRPDGHGLAVLSGARIGAAGPNRLLVIDKEQLLELWSAPGSGKWSSRPYFTNEQLHSMPALTHLSGLYVDPRGGVWLGCDEGICHAEGGQVRVWDVEGGVPKDTWHTWLSDREGNIWARGLQHIVVLERNGSVFRKSRHAEEQTHRGGIQECAAHRGPAGPHHHPQRGGTHALAGRALGGVLRGKRHYHTGNILPASEPGRHGVVGNVGSWRVALARVRDVRVVGLAPRSEQQRGLDDPWGTAPFSIAFTIFIYMIEVLVAFLQAFIFTMLTAVFVGQAIEGKLHQHHQGHEDSMLA